MTALESKEQRVIGVSQVSPDSLEFQGSPDLRGQSDPEERRAAMDLRDCQAPKESEVLLDCQDSPEHQDFQVCLARTDLRDPEGFQGATAQREREVCLENQESQGSKGSWVHPACRDKRETQVM